MDKRRDRLYKVKRTLKKQSDGSFKAYYFRNGKRISDAKGRTKWIQQNYEKLDKPYAKDKPLLTEKERLSFNQSRSQRNLFTYKGKKIPKVITEFMKLTDQLDPKSPREITQILNADGTPRYRNYGEFEKDYERAKERITKTQTYIETKVGARGHRGRESNQSVYDVMEYLNILGSQWKLLVINTDDTYARGKKEGAKAIQDWELKQTEILRKANKNVALVRFEHNIEFDFNTKTIIIDLNQTIIPPPDTSL
jgi:hypothetical protein